MHKTAFLISVIFLMGFVPIGYAQQEKPTIQKGQLLPAPKILRSTMARQFSKGSSSTVFEENFETGGSSWSISGSWSIGKPTSGPNSGHNSNNCAGTNLSGEYSDYADDWLISPSVYLPVLTYPSSQLKLSFWEWFEIESDYDYGNVEISTDDGFTWTEIDSRTGGSNWKQTEVDLSSFAGQTIKIAFHFTSDYSYTYAGWYIDDICIQLEQPEPLGATMVSLNHQKFPFIYMNVAVDTFSVGFPDLIQTNFQVYENDILQNDYFEVTPPESGCESRLADIIFVLDVTGSMEDEINAVKENMLNFVNALVESGIDYGIGFVVFGDIFYTYNYGNLYYDQSTILNIINNITLGEHNIGNGDDATENQLGAMAEAANMNFRPGAQRVEILLTDAPSHESDWVTDLTVETLIERLKAANVTVFPVFDNSDSDQLDQYVPIADAINSTGSYYHIYDNFNNIISQIGSTIAATYLVRYKSSNPILDGTERNVRVLVSYGSLKAQCEGRYIPGSMPIIMRTQETMVLHDRAWAQGTEFTIEVEIQDNVSPYVQSATLYFKNTSASSYQSTTMTNISGNLWQGTIYGSYVQTPGLDYYITATDGENTASDPSVDPINNPYQIAILPNVAPQINHTPIANLAPDAAITISAEIIDNTNYLGGAKLYYRKTGQLVYQDVVMINTSSNNYEAEIPASFVTSNGVDYYIKAWDDFGVSGYSGTPDKPYQIEALEDLSIYLDQKLNIINSINNVERPAKLKDDPLFKDIENEAFNFTTNIKDKWLNETADSTGLEAVARLAISENTTLKAIQDIIPISSYGAKGLRSFGTSVLLTGIFKGLGKICKNVPLIGNSINKTLTKISGKFEKGTQKLFHIYLTGRVPVQGVPYQTTIPEFIASKNAANAAFKVTREKIAEAGINAISNNTVDLSLFEKVDNYIQDYLFIDAFEAVADNKQSEAVKMAQQSKFEQEFTTCKQDVTQTFAYMVRWNLYVNKAEHFVNTLHEIADWVAFAVGIILIIAGIIAAIPTGGASLLASIAGLATSMLTYSILISNTFAITEASTVGVYVDAIIPNVFLNKTVDQAFGISGSKLLAKNNANIHTIFAKATTIGLENELENEYKYIERMQAQALDDNHSFLQNLNNFNSFIDKSTTYENQILALYTSVLDTALSIDSTYYERLSQLSTLMASRIMASSALDIYCLVLNNDLHDDVIKNEVISFLNTYKTNLQGEMAMISQIGEFIEENKLPFSPIIGIKDVKCYKDGGKAVIKAEVQNYSNLGPLSDISVILKANSIVQSDSVVILTLSSQQIKDIQFEVSLNNKDYISGIIYTSDHNSQEIYKHMVGYPFSFDLEFVAPVTGEGLKNENIYFYPNPFNPDKELGTIRYSLSKPGNVTIKIFDVANVLVRTIIKDAPRDGGVELAEQWDGKNENWDVVANGTYFYVIESSTGERAVGKVAVLR